MTDTTTTPAAFVIPADELRQAARTYGAASDFGLRARLVGAWFDADAATPGGPTLTNESVATMLAEARATARFADADTTPTAEEFADAVQVYRVSPASITQARNAYRIVVATGARDAAHRTDAMTAAAEALAAGGNAKAMIAKAVTVAAMPEAVRVEELSALVDTAAREARARKADAARDRKAATDDRKALPADAKADDRAVNAFAALFEAHGRITRALSVAELSDEGAKAARAALADFRGSLDSLDALAAMSHADRVKAFGKAPAVKPAEAPAEAPAAEAKPAPKPRATRKPRAAVAA